MKAWVIIFYIKGDWANRSVYGVCLTQEKAYQEIERLKQQSYSFCFEAEEVDLLV